MMAIKKLTITTVDIIGDQHGERALHTWSTKYGEFKQVNQVLSFIGDADWEKKLIEAGYQRGIQPSDINAIAAKLEEYVAADEADKLTALLQRDFIYPGILSSFATDNDQSKGEWFEEKTETYKARPVIEALMLDRPDLAVKIVEKLIEKNDEKLYQAFIASLQGTDLNSGTLFHWDARSKQSLLRQLDAVKEYSDRLILDPDEDTHDRGRDAYNLANEVSKKVAANNWDTPDTATNFEKFGTLQFKLEISSELHSKDHEFAIHRDGGWKQFITNILISLFTLGAANVYNYMQTGNTFFSVPTTSQQKLSNVQEELGFDAGESFFGLRS